MTRAFSMTAVFLVAAVGFGLPAAAAAPADREAASEAPAAGKTNRRAWPMTISMGYGSDQRCALDACADEGAVTRTRARPTTLAMGAGSDRRCALAEQPAICRRG
jgi:hypothetical protein